MKIYIGADHAGFEAKEGLKKSLQEAGFEMEDLGNTVMDEADDYPDFIVPVAKAVAEHEGSKGIVLGGSGQGEVMAANKIKGIRAALIYDEYSAKLSRQHNDANVASFGGRTLSVEKIQELAMLWLGTEFSNEERHQRRIDKLNSL